MTVRRAHWSPMNARRWGIFVVPRAAGWRPSARRGCRGVGSRVGAERSDPARRLQRVAGLVPARRRRQEGPLHRGRARRRPQVLRRLHRRRSTRSSPASSTSTPRRSTTRSSPSPPGADQKIVVTGDNSTGNDAVICDESITSIADLKGKTIAAEAGVVDHFLLLQGLATEGHDRGRHRLPAASRPTRPRRRSPAASSTASPSSPRSRSRRSSEPGSHVLFSSKDFPGRSPTTSWPPRTRRPTPVAMQKLVERLVHDARLHRGQPRRGDEDHGREGGGLSTPRSTRRSPRARRCSPPTRRSTRSATGPTTPPRCPRWPGGSTRSSSSPG